MRLNHLILTIGFLVVSPIAYAISYDTESLNYSDRSQFSGQEAMAISVLSQEKVLLGNPDGTFNVKSNLNRAEFITIAMRLLDDSDIQFDLECFPDVRPFIWYAASVCEAKALGIVSG
ncbi:S-layer homology domain-containing protein, partial [Candidatus Peregrinibacteria bacterium]|nr:S-layer homology domain-containing protein [Candidatus Peregrinibacteria bacterium]